jgi:hypothetical protein
MTDMALPGRFTLRNRRKAVLLGIFVACLLIFGAGMAAAWLARNNTICKDGKPPVAQMGGQLDPTIYKCHNGEIVTQPG